MKLGQMASYLDEGLPEPMRMALAQLRSDAPPMSGDLAAGVIESEFGSATRGDLRRVGSCADRRRVDRSGPPGDRARPRVGRRDPGRGQGPVPGRRRGDHRRSEERRDARHHPPPGLRRPRPGRHGRRDQGAARRGARLSPRGTQPGRVRRLLPRSPVHPRAGRASRRCRPVECSPPSSSRARRGTNW